MIDYREKLDKLKRDHDLATEEIRRMKVSLIDAENQLEHAKQGQELVQHVAQAVQQKAHEQIAAVVSRCLEAVFDEPYEFRIEFTRKRGRTEAELVFVRDDLSVQKPQDAVGGGVVDVAGFALRLACLVLTRPPLRRMMVLDEAFRFVSVEYLPRVRQLLEGLSEEMGVQFVQVTHIDALRCGKVIEFGVRK